MGRVQRWLLALASTSLALGVAEVALRMAGLPGRSQTFRFVDPDGQVFDVFDGVGHGLVDDPELFWRLDPDSGDAPTTVNRVGLRGWLPTRAKGARDLRIACVGDSCTFGAGVRYEDTFGIRIERALQVAHPHLCVEVILAALPGYSSHQSRVLFERHVAGLAPDVTILYCGAWNDYLPAVGWTDAQRGRWMSGTLRLRSLLARAFGPDAVTLERHRDAFRAGGAPFGRRVPLAEFRDNLLAIVRQAQASGSRVIVVVPPVPPRTAREHPLGADYREVVREVARTERLLVLDGERVFGAHAGELLFSDWVHPTARGHEVLATALLPVVSEATSPLPPRDGAEAAAPTIEVLGPRSISALAPALIEIEGRRLDTEVAFDRVLLGGRWLPEVGIVDAEHLTVRVTRSVPPGEHVLTLCTARGLVHAATPIVVVPPVSLPLRARAWRSEDGLRIEVSGTALGDLVVAVWLANGLRAHPVPSDYGPFHLAVAGAAGDSGTPIRLADVDLPRLTTMTARDGDFRLECVVPPEFDRAGSEVFAQALVFDRFDPPLGVLTQVARITLPK